MTQRKTGRRAITPGAQRLIMPTGVFPEYDLGDLADRDAEGTDAQRQQYETWRGWKVVYRAGVITSAIHEFRTGDFTRSVNMLSNLVAGWNFCDDAGDPLPQPTRKNFFELGLPDALIAALMLGFYEVIKVPKAT